ADYRPLVPMACRILAGACYALLRPAFAARRPAALARRRAAGSVERILVAMGMGDPDDASGRVLDGIRRSGTAAAVDIVLGGRAPHLDAVRRRAAELPGPARVLTDVADMAGLMTEADLAFGAGGTTSWERCCLGLPSLILVVADNQDKIAAELAAAGAVLRLGRHPEMPATAIAAALLSLDGPCRRAMAETAAGICDGRGIEHVLEALS
ncbi:MAG: UDP-2,4-diacetamido-2,4,6-trideoxy-beta-L-altropyranose hydrolase, partial [Rhodospirillales bacterium]|nr:UDP-2,4-diacetamido-2,4,6-trideoxy-beta-L-altropyranose hydrolase [Rhodospirillales bacterium]